MSNDNQYEIYPRRFFDASPTWFAWNKLTIDCVHSLRQEPGFEGQGVFFHLNHPIRYISVTGLVLQIELGGGTAATRFCFITIDDGSGSILEVKIARRRSDGMEYPSSTYIDNVDVTTHHGLPTVLIDKKPLTLGQPIRVRGTLDSFREKPQLDLKKIKVLQSTTEEMQSWNETADWHRDILSKPWTLTLQEQQRLDASAEAERAKAVDRDLRKRAITAHETKKRLHADRKAAAEQEQLQALYDDGALSGSGSVKMPWE